ncbi:Transcription factor bHLH113 [Apostasia shenzhenica]|uniref:Transcription factor bHLH113 n=1 Tax=Apostasia shenzhenica TaxID=1088818 RepID=A0A2I0B247_9ASPA|nr:Transcription factor bHLH113 [Apostasia shenzhenica]
MMMLGFFESEDPSEPSTHLCRPRGAASACATAGGDRLAAMCLELGRRNPSFPTTGDRESPAPTSPVPFVVRRLSNTSRLAGAGAFPAGGENSSMAAKKTRNLQNVMADSRKKRKPVEQTEITHNAPEKRTQKIGDKITALQQLVSPFGKTDTASVLQQAAACINILHEQIKVLSNPYFVSNPSISIRVNGGEITGFLHDRGLCLVPISPAIVDLTNRQALNSLIKDNFPCVSSQHNLFVRTRPIDQERMRFHLKFVQTLPAEIAWEVPATSPDELALVQTAEGQVQDDALDAVYESATIELFHNVVDDDDGAYLVGTAVVVPRGGLRTPASFQFSAQTSESGTSFSGSATLMSNDDDGEELGETFPIAGDLGDGVPRIRWTSWRNSVLPMAEILDDS